MLTRIAIAALLVTGGCSKPPARPSGVITSARTSPAEPDPAKSKMQAMVEALGAAKSISYNVECSGDGALFAIYAPHMQTAVRMQRSPDNDKAWMYRIEGTAMFAGARPGEATSFLVVGNGTRTRWKDDPMKMVYERFDSGLPSSPYIEMSMQACAIELLRPAQVDRALSAASITLEGEAEIAGTLCDVILCDNDDGRARRFFLAQTDHLPRRIEHRITGDRMDDAQVWLLTDVRVGEVVPAGSFEINVPAGWALNPP